MATQDPKHPQGQADVPAYSIPEVKVHVMAKKWLYFAISGALMVPGIIAMFICMQKFGAPLRLGIDFTGGSLMQIRFEQKVEVDQFRHALEKVRIHGVDAEGNLDMAAPPHKVEGEIQNVVETAQRGGQAASAKSGDLFADVSQASPSTDLFSTGSAATMPSTATVAVAESEAGSGGGGGSSLILRTKELKPKQIIELKEALNNADLGLGKLHPERVESVGPKIGAELMRNALYALAAGIVMILAYIAFRYQFDFAVCAIAAMIHDVVVMTGMYAILSLTLGAEADGLFITALLTVMGFSVHDTIVIFDRFRENLRYAQKGDHFEDIADRSINQTFLRSIYTSATVMLSLLPLVLFGGSSVFFFTLAMVIGIASGTYSSIFNAAPLLVLWRDGMAARSKAASPPPAAA